MKHISCDYPVGWSRLGALRARPAVLAALLICALPAVARTADDSGGTIFFAGRIVAPPFEIRVAPTALSSTRSAVAEGSEISFSGNSGQSASVRADGLDNLPLLVHCIDAKTTRTGSCHIGPQGGIMSVAAKAAGPAGARAVILTVAYD